MAKDTRMMKNLNDGSVGKVLVSFAMPLFLSNLLQAVYNIVDMVVAGQVLGSSGMSGVSIGGDVLHLLTFIAMGFSGAGQVVISQYVGAGEKGKIKKNNRYSFHFPFPCLCRADACYLHIPPSAAALSESTC